MSDCECRLSKVRLLLVIAAILAAAGCDRIAAWTNPQPTLPPLQAMNDLIRRGQWFEAWQYCDEVRTQHPDDAKVLAKIARVAHESEHFDEAATWLMAACQAESFADETRNSQAVVAAIAVGRLFDAIDSLTAAVAAQPEQLETRRLLFDLLIGTENRSTALQHGHYLIRKRRFDLELLMSQSNTEHRTLDSLPLEEMVKRNPSDKRPLIGNAKSAFDEGLYPEAIELLDQILALHENNVTAQVMLGQALAAAGKFERLDAWAIQRRLDSEREAGYWLAIGDWEQHRGNARPALRAYWEATRRDPDVLEAWVRLRNSINQTSEKVSDRESANHSLAEIDKRIELLSRLHQLKHRFVRTGSISRASAIEIVKTLANLGRLWEAEAWAAIALTFPEDPATNVAAARQEVVAQLSQDTPWQVIAGYGELQLDLSTIELPLIARSSLDSFPTDDLASRQQVDTNRLPAVVLTLDDEADKRGLHFFGRPGEWVFKPGVPFYQTLGCGGGAIDFDRDGWTDLYLITAGGTPPGEDSAANGLMRNVAGTFIDVTAQSQTGDRGFGHGVAVGDINEDGFCDLLVLNYGPNKVFINNGDGTFSNQTARWLDPHDSRWSTSAAIADLDADGIADVVIVNYCAGLEGVTKVCDDPQSSPGTVARSCSPLAFAAEADQFLQGQPDGSWVDRSESWVTIPSVVGRGLGITVGQFDQLPGIDLLIANDMTNNHYWSPRPGNEFGLVESAIPRGLAGNGRSLPQGSMGIATADMDRDGDIDFLISNFMGEYNTYHSQQQLGNWADLTTAAGLVADSLPLVGFGTHAIDVDNDGSLELVVANGHVENFEDISDDTKYAQPMQLFRQTEAGSFLSVADQVAGEYMSKLHVGRALWLLDANRDGRTDFAVTHQTEPVALVMNQTKTPFHFVDVRLVGRSCGRDAIGAVVEINTGDERWMATLTSGDGYLCSNDGVLHFGLGQTSGLLQVTVHWPSGESTIGELSVDAEWLIVEGSPPFALATFVVDSP